MSMEGNSEGKNDPKLCVYNKISCPGVNQVILYFLLLHHSNADSETSSTHTLKDQSVCMCA